MKIILVILAFCSLFVNRLWAKDKDTISLTEHLSLWKRTFNEVERNPAFMHDAYATSMTYMQLKLDNQTANRAIQLEKGSSHTLMGASVKSFLKLNQYQTVWGYASYRIGRKRQIMFNSTSDYDLLYPYVMGDTLGGNLENEQYAFGGGYGTDAGRWHWGAEMKFRAEHEYRTIDPRPRGIATDLTLRLGVAYQLSNYKLGMGAGVRTYKQTNNVDFYNPLGVIPVYHFTGLGTDYVRFAGAIRSSYYKATGFIADFQMVPLLANGFYFSLQQTFMPYQNILTELNALPISKLNVNETEVKMGWKLGGKFAFAPYAGLYRELREGNECVAGSSSSTEYKSLITLSMFSNKKTEVYLGSAVHWQLDKQTKNTHDFTLDGRLGWLDERAEYVDLKREMSYQKVFARLAWQWMWQSGKQWLIRWDGNVAHYHNTSRHILMPYAWMDKQITSLVDHTYAMKTAHQWNCSTTSQVYHYPERWKGVGIFLSVEAAMEHLTNIRQYQIQTSVGFTF
ncbi:MAG: hypothetical protein SOZ07_05765 [Prevotella sp.]|nr:hypothetical protein [Prevotellaceae bacterium]MDY3936148.1 hypothetical protein [Prevotella sp.]